MNLLLPGFIIANYVKPNSVVQLVVSPIADPGVASLIPYFHGHSAPSADSRQAVVSYKQKYVH